MTVVAVSALERVVTERRRRARFWRYVVLILSLILLFGFAATLMLGQSFTPPLDVWRVLLGDNVPGASFTVGHLRLPRAILSILVGMSFGLGGVAFQIMLRNPLASPDIIGVSYGASAAAVFAIVVLRWDSAAVTPFAVLAGLMVALLVYGLSLKNGAAGTRLILIGIGVAAMIESFIAYILLRAPAWDLQEAMRWLTGSVNAAQLSQAWPVLISLLVFGGILLSRRGDLDALRMGDDTAAALGVRVDFTRAMVIVCAVGMIAVATAVTGPIAFVAFLSGPIAARVVGSHGSILIPSALTGACLVLVGDYIGQFLLPSRYPVGVVTGAMGAPYLLYLIIRVNRRGASL